MPVIAIVLALSAAVAHAAWNVVAHNVSRAGVPFLWWGALASTVIWIGAIPFTGGLGTDDLAGFALGVAVSSVLHVLYMSVLQRGYQAGDLSTVYATARGSGPFLSVIIAMLCSANGRRWSRSWVSRWSSRVSWPSASSAARHPPERVAASTPQCCSVCSPA